MPKVSIITTTYKHQDFIEKTIESILGQTFSDWELLIGDDSPDDETWSIIEKYVKKYPEKIKAWHHSPNKGIIDNMNFLIEKVSEDTEYIAFLEGDDLFTPDNLEEKLKIFSSYKNVKMVYNNLDFINEKGEVFYKNFLKKSPFYLKNQKLSKKDFIKYETFYGSYSSLMIEKNVLLNEKILNPTNDKLFSVSDWDLFFRISNKYNCYGIEKSLTLYRRHGNNLTNCDKKENILLKSFFELLKYYKEIKFLNEIQYKLLFGRICLGKACDFLEKGDKKNAIIFFYYSLINNFNYSIKSKIFTLLRIIIPHRLQNIILKKYYYK